MTPSSPAAPFSPHLHRSQIGELEAQYFAAEHSQAGNALKGFEGFLSSKEALRKRPRGTKPEDRLFSLSSKTSPATREMELIAAEAEQPMFGSSSFGRKRYDYSQKGYAQKGYATTKDRRG